MDKCPVCHKFFEETWNGTEYCPTCGQTKTQALRKAPPASATATKVITYTATEQWMIDLTHRMYAEHGFEHHPTVFRNRRGSYEHVVNGKCQIVFGYECLETAMRDYLYRLEYKTIRYAWAGQGELAGQRGAWALVLHEFAHVIQQETGTLHIAGSNKYHNSNFVKALKELQTLYPFEEVK
jgi:hypothetical protein